MFKDVVVLVDNESWILPYAKTLVSRLRGKGIDSRLYRHQDDIPVGDVCFMLGCKGIVRPDVLQKNAFNMVVHESDLPSGKGFAPVAWQILEGKNTIPVCLFRAGEAVDSGEIWLKDYIELDGTELCGEWRGLQGDMSVKLAIQFIDDFKDIKPAPQKGESTFYSRRAPKDSELDMNKSIGDQFDLLRVVDNKDYPAFFLHMGVKYRVEIYREE